MDGNATTQELQSQQLDSENIKGLYCDYVEDTSAALDSASGKNLNRTQGLAAFSDGEGIAHIPFAALRGMARSLGAAWANGMTNHRTGENRRGKGS